MQSVVGMALLVVGVVLLVFGMQASASVSSRLSELFTGTPRDRTIWLLCTGVAAAFIGVGMVRTGRRHPLYRRPHPFEAYRVQASVRPGCRDEAWPSHDGEGQQREGGMLLDEPVHRELEQGAYRRVLRS